MLCLHIFDNSEAILPEDVDDTAGCKNIFGAL